MHQLAALSDDLKEALIQEHPDGLWIVLAEEYPQSRVTAADLIGVEEP